ncbi:probable deoxyhypusine synthase isoform X1 [Dreissena polymorpha]|uniref:deoxyhypusine synthase n=1 Tax=Dreissena polymorpha TaxID=45954 RepID=A0A9D4NAJ4_DREPO|nr:probable deoxyhypusine synthase isoform X1 [Dreissena polymorpha]KAH3890815.1 hypothetical protein DPMN_014904 [Dreissena polymorpha]
MEKNPNAENGNMPPSLATDAVLLKSEAIPNGTPIIKGYDFNEGLDYHRLLQTYMTSGFQAQNFGKAVEEINRMISCKLSPLSQEHTIECNSQQTYREKTNCTIFLSYTSNMISAGVREIIRFLVQHKMVDCIVTTAGGVEEDFIKCMAPTYMGDFNLSGRMLRDKGINRTGNLLVPNDNYCKFHDWMMPILDVMLEEQKSVGTLWTPSRMIDRLGKEINHPDSVYYWAHKNSIPVFSPALTDGSLGDQFFFHSFKKPGLVLDIIEDIRAINSIAIQSSNTGMIIVGAGLIKHHTCNANMMRNGADFAVYLNTSSEFDGSDSGASPDEAVSWGKIRKTATPVKICAEASLVFPLLIAETFVRRQQEFKNFRVTLAAEN